MPATSLSGCTSKPVTCQSPSREKCVACDSLSGCTGKPVRLSSVSVAGVPASRHQHSRKRQSVPLRIPLCPRNSDVLGVAHDHCVTTIAVASVTFSSTARHVRGQHVRARQVELPSLRKMAENLATNVGTVPRIVTVAEAPDNTCTFCAGRHERVLIAEEGSTVLLEFLEEVVKSWIVHDSRLHQRIPPVMILTVSFSFALPFRISHRTAVHDQVNSDAPLVTSTLVEMPLMIVMHACTSHADFIKCHSIECKLTFGRDCLLFRQPCFLRRQAGG